MTRSLDPSSLWKTPLPVIYCLVPQLFAVPQIKEMTSNKMENYHIGVQSSVNFWTAPLLEDGLDDLQGLVI
jgi:hypothetical protein